MKMIAIILTILARFLSIKCEMEERTYILTRFNDIHAYTQKMVQHTSININDMKNTPEGMAGFRFCKSLLGAPIFEFSSEVKDTTLKRTDTGYHEIDSNALTALRTICLNRSNNNITLCYIADALFWLPLINCVDHESQLSWLASFSINDSVGILFTTDPKSDNNIYGLIDQTTRMKRFYPLMNDQFLSSVHRTSPTGKELLCDLKKISQFRLCSICADIYHRKVHHIAYLQDASPYKRPKYGYAYVDEYADPYFNLYIDEQYGTQNNCENISVNTYGYLVKVSALFCHVSVKGSSYEFYLKRNLNTINKVHMIQRGKIAGEMTINQMSNIITVDANL